MEDLNEHALGKTSEPKEYFGEPRPGSGFRCKYSIIRTNLMLLTAEPNNRAGQYVAHSLDHCSPTKDDLAALDHHSPMHDPNNWSMAEVL